MFPNFHLKSLFGHSQIRVDLSVVGDRSDKSCTCLGGNILLWGRSSMPFTVFFRHPEPP